MLLKRSSPPTPDRLVDGEGASSAQTHPSVLSLAVTAALTARGLTVGDCFGDLLSGRRPAHGCQLRRARS